MKKLTQTEHYVKIHEKLHRDAMVEVQQAKKRERDAHNLYKKAIRADMRRRERQRQNDIKNGVEVLKDELRKVYEEIFILRLKSARLQERMFAVTKHQMETKNNEER